MSKTSRFRWLPRGWYIVLIRTLSESKEKWSYTVGANGIDEIQCSEFFTGMSQANKAACRILQKQALEKIMMVCSRRGTIHAVMPGDSTAICNSSIQANRIDFLINGKYISQCLRCRYILNKLYEMFKEEYHDRPLEIGRVCGEITRR